MLWNRTFGALSLCLALAGPALADATPACQLLSESEAAGIVGAGRLTSFGDQPAPNATICRYQWAVDGVLQTLEIVLIEVGDAATARSQWDASIREAVAQGMGEEIGGIGDAAFLAGHSSADYLLAVLNGGRQINVKGAGLERGVLESAARTAAGRM